MTFVVCLAAVVLIKRPPAAESTPSIIKAFILDEGIRLGILSRNRAVFLDGEAEMARRDCCHEIHTVVLTCISWHEKRQNRLILRHEINGSVLTCISWPGGSGALPHYPGPKTPPVPWGRRGIVANGEAVAGPASDDAAGPPPAAAGHARKTAARHPQPPRDASRAEFDGAPGKGIAPEVAVF